MDKRIEFALFEFGDYEFGIESGALIRAADFVAQGSASVSANSSKKVTASFSISGKTTLSLDTNSTANSKYITSGTGLVDAKSLVSISANFLGQGIADFAGVSGKLTSHDFNSASSAVAEFYFTEGPEFHVRAAASVSFHTEATAIINFDIEGIGAFNASAAKAVNLVYSMDGSSFTEFKGNSYHQAGYALKGYSDNYFYGQEVKVGNFTINGISVSTPRIAGVYDVIYSANGSSVVNGSGEYASIYLTEAHFPGTTDTRMRIQAITYSLFNSEGHALVVPEGSIITPVMFGSESTSKTIWFRGQQTLSSLTSSPYSTIRPHEIRSTEWRL